MIFLPMTEEEYIGPNTYVWKTEGGNIILRNPWYTMVLDKKFEVKHFCPDREMPMPGRNDEGLDIDDGGGE